VQDIVEFLLVAAGVALNTGIAESKLELEHDESRILRKLLHRIEF
jgi:hypothetical protein